MGRVSSKRRDRRGLWHSEDALRAVLCPLLPSRSRVPDDIDSVSWSCRTAARASARCSLSTAYLSRHRGVQHTAFRG
eukprot:3835421-Rhodomonas_salina.2